MLRIRKLFSKPIVWFLGIAVLYAISRLINLTALPIFTDEAIYIRWSQIGGNDATWRFISLTDGKQPLFTWFMMAALRIFEDPLVAGRIVSVVAGFASIFGLYVLGSELFKKQSIGVIASLLYLISPFALMYDRMALYDAWVATFFIWNTYLTVLLVRRIRLDVALILGLTLGLGMLNKTSAFFSLYLLPASVLLFDFRGKRIGKRLLTWIGFCIVAAMLSQAVYGILRLSPFFYIVAQKDKTFIYSFSEWLRHPFEFVWGNLHGEFDWIINYLTLPIFLTALAPLAVFWKRPLEKLMLLGWWFGPFLALALFGRVIYPRFVLFMAMPLLVLSAVTFEWILSAAKPKIVAIVLFVLLSFPAMKLSSWILSDIKTAPIPKSDIGQYINDWPSGWGTKEITAFLKNEAQDKHIAVYTEGTFGLLPFAFEIYLGENKNIAIYGLWPPPATIPDTMVKSAYEQPTYFVQYQSQVPYNWPLTLIAKYPKGTSQDVYMYLYKVSPANAL